jgi:hypothetical protein
VDGLLDKGESCDESANTLVGFPCWNVTRPNGSGNPAIFVAHTIHAVTSVGLGQVKIANVGGEFFFRSCVGSFRHSEDGINGFDAGFKDFFGYTVHVILVFWLMF